MKKTLTNILYPVFVVLLILLFWQIAAWRIGVDLILPTPTEAFLQLRIYLGKTEFWTSVGWSLLRSLESFLLGFAIALVLAILSYLSDIGRKLIQPWMALVRAVPTMAVILILILWLSPSNAPIVVSVIVISPTLYTAFLSGLDQIDLRLVEMADVYRIPKKQRILKMYLPLMSPVLWEQSASGMSLNLKLIIAAEALAQSAQSIGKLMQYAKIALETEKLFALTITAVILSFLLEYSIRFVGKKCVRWQGC